MSLAQPALKKILDFTTAQRTTLWPNQYILLNRISISFLLILLAEFALSIKIFLREANPTRVTDTLGTELELILVIFSGHNFCTNLSNCLMAWHQDHFGFAQRSLKK